MNRELIDDILSRRESGQTRPQIAADLGITIGAVDWACLSFGVSSPSSSRRFAPRTAFRDSETVRRFTPEEDALMLELRGQGLNDLQISIRLGRRHSSVKARFLTLARREAFMEAQ